MPDADRDLDELRGRVARLEVALASVELETSFWGRVLRLLSVATIAFVVMLVWGLLGLRP
jgi:predicted DNA-binding ribbon-helix-helix protein